MDPKLRELAELLIFDDYQTYLQESRSQLSVFGSFLVGLSVWHCLAYLDI